MEKFVLGLNPAGDLFASAHKGDPDAPSAPAPAFCEHNAITACSAPLSAVDFSHGDGNVPQPVG